MASRVPTQKQPGMQFSLGAMMAYVTLLCMLLAFLLFLGREEATVFCMTSLPLWITVPPLARRLYRNEPQAFSYSGATALWLVFVTGLYPVAAMFLATISFAPVWRFEKGDHWVYYVLDAPAGFTLLPVFAAGAASYCRGLVNPAYARRSPLNAFLIGTCVVISAGYVVWVLCLKFTRDNMLILAAVPAGTAACHAVYLATVLRQAEFEKTTRSFWTGCCIWLFTVVTAVIAKIPLAQRLFESLPETPPDDCFIVTAATRGHAGFVQTWTDRATGCRVNQQLLTMRRFEAALQGRLPRFHWCLRAPYNRLAPSLARCLVFRWQADLTYLMLKPAEWFAAAALRLFKLKS